MAKKEIKSVLNLAKKSLKKKLRLNAKKRTQKIEIFSAKSNKSRKIGSHSIPIILLYPDFLMPNFIFKMSISTNILINRTKLLILLVAPQAKNFKEQGGRF